MRMLNKNFIQKERGHIDQEKIKEKKNNITCFLENKRKKKRKKDSEPCKEATSGKPFLANWKRCMA